MFPQPGKFYAAAGGLVRSPTDIHGPPALAWMVPQAGVECIMELPLSLTPGHRGTLVASPGTLGWDVRADVDGVTVLQSHASDWHRVERLRARVEASVAATPVQSVRGGAGAG